MTIGDAWILWYLSRKDGDRKEAILFAVEQQRSQIGCNVGIRNIYWDAIHRLIVAGVYPDEFRVRKFILLIRQLDADDLEARKFIERMELDLKGA